MIDAATLTLVENVIRKVGLSLLQYVAESYPWTPADKQGILLRLEKDAREEREGARALMALLLKKRHRTPYLGSYPEHFTAINYCSLKHLLPFLVEEVRGRIAYLEAGVPQASDGDVRELLTRILEVQRRHLKTVEEYAS